MQASSNHCIEWNTDHEKVVIIAVSTTEGIISIMFHRRFGCKLNNQETFLLERCITFRAFLFAYKAFSEWNWLCNEYKKKSELIPIEDAPYRKYFN